MDKKINYLSRDFATIKDELIKFIAPPKSFENP